MHSVEAAVIVPMILFLFCGILQIGFGLHNVVKKTADLSQQRDIAVMEEIRRMDGLQEIKEIMNED